MLSDGPDPLASGTYQYSSQSISDKTSREIPRGVLRERRLHTECEMNEQPNSCDLQPSIDGYAGQENMTWPRLSHNDGSLRPLSLAVRFQTSDK